MGLLNRKSPSAAPLGGIGQILSKLTTPYSQKDMLLAVLDQLSEAIPAEGYYAYASDGDGTHLTLKVTRAATGIATVGPNYAGLVLGAGLRAVPLEIIPLRDPWSFEVGADGVLEIGFGPRAAFRLAVDPKARFTEADRARIHSWLKPLEAVLDLVSMAEHRTVASETRLSPDVRRSRQDLLLQIPHLMGMLSQLGTSVVKGTDGYLALWHDESSALDLIWESGLGRQLAERLSPRHLYRSARPHRFAVWDGAKLPAVIQEMGFHTLMALPLEGGDSSAGVFVFAVAETLKPSRSLADSLGFLATSLENSLASRGASMTMAENYLDSLFTAALLLDEADPFNKNHHRQVAQLAARLALKAGWPESRVRAVETAGRLHDIGMVGVALEVTTQRGNLAEQAREIIQQHPTVGAELLAGLPETLLPPIVVRSVREHHERWDGQGYPHGLRGTELSEEGRVLACAEQFVARISNRSYRQGLSVERALYDVRHLAGGQLDPKVVELLMGVYAEAGVVPGAPA